MDQQLSYKLSLDIVDLKKKAKEAQDEINRIEQEILELNRLKVELVDPKDKAMAKQVRQEIERLNNALKEQRLALRTVNEATKEKTKLLKEAVKAQNEVTDSIERSRVEAKKELAEMKLSDRRAAVQADKDAAKAKKEAEAASKALAISLNRESNAMSGLTKQQQQFRNQAGASNNVALEFNRIIQDAPFGIIGIGNNIQQLTANFSQLKATSTSTGAALSSALSSIISPANLVLLGISALTSLWTAYQLGAFDSAEETKSLADVMDELDEEISNTVDSLGALEKAFYKSASGAFQEKLELDSLFAIMRDSNKSIETTTLTLHKSWLFKPRSETLRNGSGMRK
jgi:DNA repair exonuclease SbcCD ATPase subunit